MSFALLFFCRIVPGRAPGRLYVRWKVSYENGAERLEGKAAMEALEVGGERPLIQSFIHSFIHPSVTDRCVCRPVGFCRVHVFSLH